MSKKEEVMKLGKESKLTYEDLVDNKEKHYIIK